MGSQCEACTTADTEKVNTLVIDPTEDYSLKPEDFYNERTR
jgi:hypothetical protein